MKRTRSLALALSVLALTLIPGLATAQTWGVHWKYSRAASTLQLDSTSIFIGTSTKDTTASVSTFQMRPTINTGLDSAYVASSQRTVHYPIALLIEVTGLFQSCDSLYLMVQGSTDNSRFVSLGTFNGTVVNTAGTQTFVFPIAADTWSSNSWNWWQWIRFISQGDTNASAVMTAVRGTLVWREQ